MAFIIDKLTSVTGNAKAPSVSGAYLYKTTDNKATVTAANYFVTGYNMVAGPNNTLIAGGVALRMVDKFFMGDAIHVQVVNSSDVILDDFTVVVSTIDYSGTSPSMTTSVTDSSISGPGSSTDEAIVRWNGTSGNALQNSNITINDSGVITTSTTNGNLVINPNGTGEIILDGLSWPTADGTVGQALVTDGAGQLSFAAAGGGGSSYNYLDNSAMDIQQRGEGAVDGAYVLDRWRWNETADIDVSINRVTTPLPDEEVANYQFRHALEIADNGSTFDANTLAYLSQGIEGTYIDGLAGDSFTVSFWFGSNGSGETGNLSIFAQNAAFTAYCIKTVNINSTGWAQYSATFPMMDLASGDFNTNEDLGIRLGFILSAGSNNFGTPDSWQSGDLLAAPTQANFMNGATYYITGIQLVRGSSSGDFTYGNPTTEIERCMRYYEKSNVSVGSFDPATSPAAFFSHSSAVCFGSVNYRVVKRADGNLDIIDAAGDTGTVSYFDGVWNDAGALDTTNKDVYGFSFSHTIAASTATAFQWVSSADF